MPSLYQLYHSEPLAVRDPYFECVCCLETPSTENPLCQYACAIRVENIYMLTEPMERLLYITSAYAGIKRIAKKDRSLSQMLRKGSKGEGDPAGLSTCLV